MSPPEPASQDLPLQGSRPPESPADSGALGEPEATSPGPGTLFIVATPIGNIADMTLRGARILREVEAVIVEQERAGSTLLHRLGIDKPLYLLNEHSTPADMDVVVERLVHGAQLALISDHGTPLVQDPGADLVKRAIQRSVRVEPIPGASAVLAALVASGIPAARFRFLGQLPAKTEVRALALEALADLKDTLVLVDAPYRLTSLLDALCTALGGGRRAAVACQLTLPDETFVRGTLDEILSHFREQSFKGEFVVVVEGKRAGQLDEESL